jgi:hypothetical protein
VDELIDKPVVGLSSENFTVLSDGSAVFCGSFPLPKDHWIYAPSSEEYDMMRGVPVDTPRPIFTHELRPQVITAVRYAIRGATMNGVEKDFDPDALVQNTVIALCGDYGKI